MKITENKQPFGMKLYILFFCLYFLLLKIYEENSHFTVFLVESLGCFGTSIRYQNQITGTSQI